MDRYERNDSLMSSPTLDLREVDSPFIREKWIQNIIDRFDKEEITTFTKEPDKIVTPEPTFTHSGIVTKLPPQYCPSKDFDNKPDEIVKVYDRHEPNHLFLASRIEIEKANSKLPYPNFIIKGSKDDITDFERFTIPHPMNHDW